MYQKIINFIRYHNAVAIGLSLVLVLTFRQWLRKILEIRSLAKKKQPVRAVQLKMPSALAKKGVALSLAKMAFLIATPICQMAANSNWKPPPPPVQLINGARSSVNLPPVRPVKKRDVYFFKNRDIHFSS